MFLPRRLGDAWHRWHPEHRYITNSETGRRCWQYDPPTMSLDGLYHADRGGNDELAGDASLAHARVLRDFVPTTTVKAA
jgi:hypothetical protein